MTAAFIIALLIACGLGLACWAQRREIERLRNEIVCWGDAPFQVVDCRKMLNTQLGLAYRRGMTLLSIANATRNGKSGTARMVHRMAMEGLGYD